MTHILHPSAMSPAELESLWCSSAAVAEAAVMSVNRCLANPCSTDSTPTSANQENHVSIAVYGARRLARMTTNLSTILNIEAICAAQGIDLRTPLATSEPLQAAMACLRAHVPALKEDRHLNLTPDLLAATALIRDDSLATAARLEIAP